METTVGGRSVGVGRVFRYAQYYFWAGTGVTQASLGQPVAQNGGKQRRTERRGIRVLPERNSLSQIHDQNQIKRKWTEPQGNLSHCCGSDHEIIIDGV